MKKAIILNFRPEQERMVNITLDRLTTDGVQVITGAMNPTAAAHLVPHFHYLCDCGWVKISALSFPTCPKCGREPAVSPDGIQAKATRIPTFVASEPTP